MSKIVKAHLAVLTANLIYGANYSIAKQVMPAFILPFGFIILRVSVSAILFFVTGFFLKREKIEKKDCIRLIACGLFGVAINQLLFFKGLSLTSPINAALMMTTNPIMVLIMAHFIIREMISFKKVLGIIIGISGAILLIVYGKAFSFSSASVSGDVMILINSLSWATFLIIVKPIMVKYHPVTIMKWTFTYGFILVVPFGFEEFKQIHFGDFPTQIMLCVFYVVIISTFLAYILNVAALNRLSPSVVSFYIYLQPLFATGFSLLLSEGTPQWIHLIAAVFIFAGVYLVSTQRSKDSNTVKH